MLMITVGWEAWLAEAAWWVRLIPERGLEMKIRHSSGFTLLEIMIVVTIIGFLAGLAIPAFMKSRSRAQTTRCIDNMRLISGAKDQWAVENFANNGDTVLISDVDVFFKRGFPECPGGGSYSIQVVGQDPTCTITGHVL